MSKQEYFIIATNDQVLPSYLKRNCSAVLAPGEIYINTNKAISYFGNQKGFLSFCRSVVGKDKDKHIHISKAEVPALDKFYDLAT